MGIPAWADRLLSFLPSEVRLRVFWGILVALFVCSTILFLGPLGTFFLALLAGLQGWKEYSEMMSLRQRSIFYYPGYLLLILMFCANFISGPHFFWIWFVWLIAFLLFAFEDALTGSVKSFSLRKEAPNEKDWNDFCHFILGLLYIFMIFGFMGPIASRPHGEKYLLLGIAIAAIGDSTAFFVGRRWGKRPLWPALSPKKTFEGALGGWIGSIIASILFWAIFRFCSRENAGLSLGFFVLCGFILAPLAQAGDFIESLMKRSTGHKDSGNLLPGHGGLLDRADSLVWALPLLYFLL